ncbi:MAG: rod shape-determining protein MreC [Chitinophagaceae bacterium]|nr:rod shape-determining protein MreC [Oligoflexus sp.]
MARSKAKIYWRVILVASLLSPFVFLSSTMRPWISSSHGLLLGQEILYPFEYIWDSGTHGISSVWRHYIDLTRVSETNTRLDKEISLLKSQMLDYEEKQSEIGRLRGLFGFAQHFQGSHIVAEIVGSQSYPNFKTMRISKGNADGVHVGMPVVTAEGVVGRVIRAGLKFADVHLLVDTNFNVDILLQRTRIRGVLKGSDTDCVLKLNRRDEVRIGDTLITSGIVGGFSKGLPVGKVIRIAYESDNISQTVTVEPWVNFDRIEEVIVLDNHDKELQKIMETAGEDWLNKPFKENEEAGG